MDEREEGTRSRGVRYSEHASDEIAVQVNDRYTGGGLSTDLDPMSDPYQHATGG